MLKLTPAERSELRSQAHGLKPVVLIGDAGLTPAVMKEIDAGLNVHGLIKVRVFGDDRDARLGMYETICAELGAEYRHTRPYSPQTNGMVERFNGRVGSEVLGITIWSHAQLEQLLRGFNAAYNARRKRVLDGKTPDEVVKERLRARRKLARPKPGMPEGRAGSDDVARARLIAEAAKEVSQPDT